LSPQDLTWTLASLGDAYHDEGTVEEMLVTHLLNLSDDAIKRSALSSLIVDVDGLTDGSLSKLWNEISKKLIELPGDGLPEDINRVITGIIDPTSPGVTALERLATACATIPISGDVYAYVTNSALTLMY